MGRRTDECATDGAEKLSCGTKGREWPTVRGHDEPAMDALVWAKSFVQGAYGMGINNAPAFGCLFDIDKGEFSLAPGWEMASVFWHIGS